MLQRAAAVSFASVLAGLLHEDSSDEGLPIPQVNAPCHEEEPANTTHHGEESESQWLAELTGVCSGASSDTPPHWSYHPTATASSPDTGPLPEDAVDTEDTEDSSNSAGTLPAIWLNLLPRGISPEFARLPRWNEVLPNLELFPIQFRLPPIGSTTGVILQHSHSQLEQLRARHPHVFKIGITCHPVQRWAYACYAYRRDSECWQGMQVIYATESAIAAAFVEAHMIYVYKGTPGCRNCRAGGDSSCVSADGPHFTYIVYKSLAPPSD
jgi:hypothetical protein